MTARVSLSGSGSTCSESRLSGIPEVVFISVFDGTGASAAEDVGDVPAVSLSGETTKYGSAHAADKRKAVMTLLQDEEWGKWSNREIARHCAVSHRMVNDLRSSLEQCSSEPPPPRTYTTKHGTTATMNTSNIGKRAGSFADARGTGNSNPGLSPVTGELLGG
jgi:hypothetical protein